MTGNRNGTDGMGWDVMAAQAHSNLKSKFNRRLMDIERCVLSACNFACKYGVRISHTDCHVQLHCRQKKKKRRRRHFAHIAHSSYIFFSFCVVAFSVTSKNVLQNTFDKFNREHMRRECSFVSFFFSFLYCGCIFDSPRIFFSFIRFLVLVLLNNRWTWTPITSGSSSSSGWRTVAHTHTH